jgi:drug/metabolite transporter (DMT)-like permease
MDRRFILAALAAFAASFALSFIFHGLLLAREYEALTAVYRGPQFRPGLFALIILAQLVMAFAMVAIYRYGHEQRPYLGQGIRFGLMAAGLSVIPCYLIGYAVTNIPASLAVKQVVLETIIVLAMAVIVAWFYRR